jgi:5'-nucleotidase
LLEQQWSAGQPSTGRILQVSNGFSYRTTFARGKPLGQHYVCAGSVTLNNTRIAKGATYRVAMNSFLAAGGENFTVFNDGIDSISGDVDVDALTSYLGARSPVAPGPQDRIVAVSSCP